MMVQGKPHLINSTHVNWRKLQKALIQNSTEEAIKELLDIEELLFNGVYYIYLDGKSMYSVYESKRDNVRTVNKVYKLEDLTKVGNPLDLQTDIPTEAKHYGTYSTLDELLTDFVERFI